MNIKNIGKLVIDKLPLTIGRNLYYYKNRYSRQRLIKEWEIIGRPLPPPHQYKQLVVEKTGKSFSLTCLVETGTFKGHMIEAQRNNFKKLFSIEIDHDFFNNAKVYFKPYNHIKILQGDSSLKLKEILSEIKNEKVLFWLDGHYSGENTGKGKKDCPILEELGSIFNYKFTSKYILIDDARCFNGTNDYPSIKDLTEFIKIKDPELSIKIVNDIIHIS